MHKEEDHSGMCMWERERGGGEGRGGRREEGGDGGAGREGLSGGGKKGGTV